MEIYITTTDCKINNNHWLLPTLEEINKIKENFSILEKYIIDNNINIREYNSKKLEDNFKVSKNELIIKEPKNNKWFIYVIKSWHLYKVWKTKNLKTRTKKYITENPYLLELIHCYEVLDMTKEEKRLHLIFSDKRKRWEWFLLSKEDILYIKTL